MESVRIPEGHGDAFVALLRTMSDADAVAFVKNAANVGLDKNHNQRELLLAKSFKPWVTEMDAKGMLDDPKQLNPKRVGE